MGFLLDITCVIYSFYDNSLLNLCIGGANPKLVTRNFPKRATDAQGLYGGILYALPKKKCSVA